MHACMFVCMYVCMHAYIYVCMNINIFWMTPTEKKGGGLEDCEDN